jgi:hypothetical protein
MFSPLSSVEWLDSCQAEVYDLRDSLFSVESLAIG